MNPFVALAVYVGNRVAKSFGDPVVAFKDGFLSVVFLTHAADFIGIIRR